MIRKTGLWGTLAVLLMSLTSCATTPEPARTQMREKTAPFVTVEGHQFMTGETPYRFVGVNMWYGAYLASDYGDRDRLLAELDHLQALGVTNLRVLAASEESPLPNSITPAFQDESGAYDEVLLEGLDLLLAEMAKRDMRAVLYLANFWEWSGGMTVYMHWDEGRDLIELGNPEVPFWPAYARLAADFYSSQAAQLRFQNYVDMLVTRTNTVTGAHYANDPTIMSWQLANEPRLGGDDALGEANLPAFVQWITQTARFIKERAPHQLVSIGNEGTVGCLRSERCYLQTGAIAEIDYLTVHMWPKNWSWIDPARMPETLPNAIREGRGYLAQHIAMAQVLDKPLVLEEFGMPRDGEAVTPGSPTTAREAFLTAMLDEIEDDAGDCGVMAGSNYWAWGGIGRAARESAIWQDGDSSYLGDPPQEPQGLNSIFDSDVGTTDILHRHADRLNSRNQHCARVIQTVTSAH